MSQARSFDYLMENERENERLIVKDDSEQTRDQLISCGVLKFLKKEGAVLVDAGCGVGVVAIQMAKLIEEHNSSAKIILVDGSSERLNQARENLKEFKNVEIEYHESTLEEIHLNDGCADFLFCRFVFEYLSRPDKVFGELCRLLKSGGSLNIGDLDNNCLNHYPLDKDLERQLAELEKALRESKLIDLQAGRKLYHYFHTSNLENIEVKISAHHLFYGKLKDSDYFNWETKLNVLEKMSRDGALKLSFDIKAFSRRFMQFLSREDRFSYTPLILVSGAKK